MDTILTEDGSLTLRSAQYGETYHSIFGARSESEHVFLSAGYSMVSKKPVSVLEMGFGSGLNAWLTLMEAGRTGRRTFYTTLERYPLEKIQWEALNRDRQGDESFYFRALHEAGWNLRHNITESFSLYKRNVDISLWQPDECFDVVYYDAFSPEVQPELWTPAIFSKICEVMNSGAVLTTYCARGEVRRTLQSLGLEVERIPGPKGKREMLRAWKR